MPRSWKAGVHRRLSGLALLLLPWWPWIPPGYLLGLQVSEGRVPVVTFHPRCRLRTLSCDLELCGRLSLMQRMRKSSSGSPLLPGLLLTLMSLRPFYRVPMQICFWLVLCSPMLPPLWLLTLANGSSGPSSARSNPSVPSSLRLWLQPTFLLCTVVASWDLPLVGLRRYASWLKILSCRLFVLACSPRW